MSTFNKIIDFARYIRYKRKHHINLTEQEKEDADFLLSCVFSTISLIGSIIALILTFL